MTRRVIATIIVPHYHDNARLQRCLAALMPQLRPNVEALVVDNGSPERPSVPAPVRLVCEARSGAAHARNRGVAESSGAILLFLDSDCVPHCDWLETALRVAKNGDVVGGAVEVFDEAPPPHTGAQLFERIFAFDNKEYVSRKGFSVTANMLTSRAVFEAVGPFRDGVSEDFDWGRRARAAGFCIAYADTLRVGHPSRANWVELRRKWRRLTREGFGVNGTSPGARAVWALRALAMPPSVLAHLPKILGAPGLRANEKSRALAVLVRLRLLRMKWMLTQAFGPAIRTTDNK
ncbi:glycosyltransferase family 2 protein [Roseivivax marinus]|uniref:glycosyltransferase family 2 protein n=1 Tax=Roseivivax marinus TaxID=1379903 RepID=UPI001F04FD98|nr:glycosyltransferase family A protein [Roseivivax marinus]UMA63311.1 glycosyltransferase family 2 protein [Roseivivax marinus]